MYLIVLYRQRSKIRPQAVPALYPGGLSLSLTQEDEDTGKTKQETEEQGDINSAVLKNREIVKVKVGLGRSRDGGA